GSLLFMEHGLAPEPGIQKWQNRLTPAWKKIGGGCHLNRNIEELISSSGFSFEQLSKKYIKGPKVATFQYCGKAIKT
ncbi:SAM-dependent methyltransferase, partial [Gammaproteobacteria bacterium]|nr:SAM-dependent methyltransferase [Gammaproteobacteria bacterium]